MRLIKGCCWPELHDTHVFGHIEGHHTTHGLQRLIVVVMRTSYNRVIVGLLPNNRFLPIMTCHSSIRTGVTTNKGSFLLKCCSESDREQTCTIPTTWNQSRPIDYSSHSFYPIGCRLSLFEKCLGLSYVRDFDTPQIWSKIAWVFFVSLARQPACTRPGRWN